MLSLCLLMAGLTGRQTFCHIVDYPAGLTHYSVLCSEMNARGDNVSCELNSPSKRKETKQGCFFFLGGQRTLPSLKWLLWLQTKHRARLHKAYQLFTCSACCTPTLCSALACFLNTGTRFCATRERFFFRAAGLREKHQSPLCFGNRIPSYRHQIT